MISRIQIEGYKSIEAVDVELGALSVLIGANASGKSNFLSVFRLLNAVTEQKLQRFIARQGGASALLLYGPKRTKQVKLSIWWYPPSWDLPGDDVGYQLSLSYIPPDLLIIDKEVIGFRNGTRASLGRGQQAESRLAEEAASESAVKFTKHFLDRFRAYHFHDTSDTAAVKQHADVQDNRSLHADAGNLAAFLYMLKTAHPSHYTEIRNTVRLAFPLFDDFVVEPARLNANKILLNWRERDSDHEFGPHQLSDGTLRFMCLAACLLQPFDHPDAPLAITIDEPELGLHPYALTLLASMLRTASKKVQIIVSTQSSSLLGAIGDPASVVVVERKGGATTLARLQPEQVDAWLEEYSLGDIWEKGVIGGRPQP